MQRALAAQLLVLQNAQAAVRAAEAAKAASSNAVVSVLAESDMMPSHLELSSNGSPVITLALAGLVVVIVAVMAVVLYKKKKQEEYLPL